MAISADRTICVEERRARLARRHRLLPERRTDDVAEIADDLVALHSSDPVSVYLSAMARMRTPSIAAVEKALYDAPVLFRHHAMRRTLWVASADVVRLMHASATRKLVAPEHTRTAKLLAASGVDDPDAWLAGARAQVLAALHRQGPMTARSLGERVPALRQPLRLAPGKKYAATVSAHTRVLLQLGFEGEVMRTRPAGSWVSGEYAWAATDSWLPGGIDGPSEREAAADLADRWLRAFGPATTVDLKWWAGWTGALAKRALADCGAVEVALDPGSGPAAPGWVAAGDEDTVEPALSWVAMVPSLDPTTMGWKERGWYLDPAAADAFDSSGNAGATIWADGRVVGAWGQARDGLIRTHYFHRVSKAQRDAVAERVAALHRAVGETRFTVRFPGSIQPVLLG